MSWDFNKGHLERIVETYIFERKKEMESAFLCEIQKIGTENGIETKIILNERKIVDALKNCQDGYKGIKAEVAREIFAEIERLLDDYHSSTHLVWEIAPLAYYDVMLEDAIAELKKKYTEEN